MDDTPASEFAYKDRQGLELQEVTNAMVRLYKELFGRGPTEARSNHAGPKRCSRPSRTVSHGGAQHAQAPRTSAGSRVRMFFQHASERKLVESIEQITGRKVRSFVSGMEAHHDVASEVLYFEPIDTG